MHIGSLHANRSGLVVFSNRLIDFRRIKCPGLFTIMKSVRPEPVRVKQDQRTQGDLKGGPAQNNPAMMTHTLTHAVLFRSSFFFADLNKKKKRKKKNPPPFTHFQRHRLNVKRNDVLLH